MPYIPTDESGGFTACLITEIYETRHWEQHQDGTILFLEDFGRPMLVVERQSKNAGNFILVANQGTSSMVNFYKPKFYTSIEEAIHDMKVRKRIHLTKKP